MSRTRKDRVRKSRNRTWRGRIAAALALCLAAVAPGSGLAAAAAAPDGREPAGHGPAVVVVESSTTRRVLATTGAAGARETLTIELAPSAEEGVREATVRLATRDDVTRFEARVRVDARTIHVEGTSGRTPFTFGLTMLGDGRFRVERTWDGGALAYDSGVLRRGTPERAVVEAFSEYRDAVVAFPDAVAAARVRAIVENAPRGSAGTLDMIAAVAAHAVDGVSETTGLRDYLVCLEETCTTCNACWEHMGYACVGCPQDPLWAQMASTACYLVFSEICWFELLNPVKGWTQPMM